MNKVYVGSLPSTLPLNNPGKKAMEAARDREPDEEEVLSPGLQPDQSTI